MGTSSLDAWRLHALVDDDVILEVPVGSRPEGYALEINSDTFQFTSYIVRYWPGVTDNSPSAVLVGLASIRVFFLIIRGF